MTLSYCPNASNLIYDIEMIVLFFLLGGVSDVGKKTKKQNKTLIP
jgi:hypothetical protein